MKISPQLINRYLEGKCPPEEVRFVNAWYDSFEDEPEPEELLNDVECHQLKHRMLTNIRSRIYEENLNRPVNRLNYRFYYTIAALAASLVIVFSVFHLFNAGKNLPMEDRLITIVNDSELLKNHILPDGSSLWLKPQTQISYRLPFGEKYREISMVGESFFDVKRDTLHPFIIHNGAFDTKVLGTSFTIKADGKEDAQLSVISGKVFVYIPKKEGIPFKGVFVLPEQKVTYKRASHELSKSTETGKELRIWEKKSFSFDNSPVSEVLSDLRRKFNVKIEVKDPAIERYTLKADFTDLSLPVILDLMSKSLNIRCGIDEETIILDKEKTENRTKSDNMK